MEKCVMCIIFIIMTMYDNGNLNGEDVDNWS